MLGYGSGDGVREEEQGAAKRMRRHHTKRESMFLFLSMRLDPRTKGLAFSKSFIARRRVFEGLAGQNR